MLRTLSPGGPSGPAAPGSPRGPLFPSSPCGPGAPWRPAGPWGTQPQQSMLSQRERKTRRKVEKLSRKLMTWNWFQQQKLLLTGHEKPSEVCSDGLIWSIKSADFKFNRSSKWYCVYGLGFGVKENRTHNFSFGSSLSLEPWNTWVSLDNNGQMHRQPERHKREKATGRDHPFCAMSLSGTWNEWLIHERHSEDIQMFLWAREVQLLPEAREAHEVQGNQEHQRYQEHPTEEETSVTHLSRWSPQWVTIHSAVSQ